MEEKKPFGTRLEAFFAGKGFYVVLFLCIAVIGVSAWSLLTGNMETPLTDNTSLAVASMDEPAIATAKTETVPLPETPVKAAPEASAAEPEVAEPAADEPAAEAPAATEPAEPTSVTVQDYYIWPVLGEVDGAYSMAALVWNPTMKDWRTHDGIDIAADLGTQVKAAASGKVTDIYEDDLCGTTVVLTHRSGLQSFYSNLAAAPTVSIGDQVDVGQVIGSVGDTALGEAGQVCHLHFAMALDGESVDPADYLP